MLTIIRLLVSFNTFRTRSLEVLEVLSQQLAARRLLSRLKETEKVRRSLRKPNSCHDVFFFFFSWVFVWRTFLRTTWRREKIPAACRVFAQVVSLQTVNAEQTETDQTSESVPKQVPGFTAELPETLWTSRSQLVLPPSDQKIFVRVPLSSFQTCSFTLLIIYWQSSHRLFFP